MEHVGSYDGWDSLSWNAINGLNDADDGVSEELDFVGDSSDAGTYWADNGTYVFFRVRVDVGTVDTGTFSDSHLLLIDVDDYSYAGNAAGTPDYGFAWDSKSNDVETHGLEMQVLGDIKSTWNKTSMDDIDGAPAEKTYEDINGFVDGTQRTTDGYLRTVDGQSTENFGDTTFIDYAVSWAYLEAYTDLEKGQSWNIALGSIANATDHNSIAADVGGGANPDGLVTEGWAPLGAVPEPTVVSLLSLSGLAMLIGRRLLPTKS